MRKEETDGEDKKIEEEDNAMLLHACTHYHSDLCEYCGHECHCKKKPNIEDTDTNSN